MSKLKIKVKLNHFYPIHAQVGADYVFVFANLMTSAVQSEPSELICAVERSDSPVKWPFRGFSVKKTAEIS